MLCHNLNNLIVFWFFDIGCYFPTNIDKIVGTSNFTIRWMMLRIIITAFLTHAVVVIILQTKKLLF